MKRLVIILIANLMPLVALTNGSPIELPDTVSALYNKPFTYSKTTAGYVFHEPKIIVAKLKLVDKFFMPAPDNCLYNDLLLDLQTQVTDSEYWHGQANKSKQTTLLLTGAGVIVGIIGGIFLGIQLGN